MSFSFARSEPRGRLQRTAATVAVLLVFAAGFIAGSVWGLTPVYAACGTVISCINDNAATSALNVSHYASDGLAYTIPVEPNTGETWSITAYWATTVGAPLGCTCKESSAGVTATATWTDGTGWSVACTGCSPFTGPIRSVSICNTDSCGDDGALDNGWGYKLIVDIDHTDAAVSCWPTPGTGTGYLQRVVYSTTSVNNGNEVDTADCTEGSSVSPTSQTWGSTDYGAFECVFSCDASGPSVTIHYN